MSGAPAAATPRPADDGFEATPWRRTKEQANEWERQWRNYNTTVDAILARERREREVADAKWQRTFETWCWIFGALGGYYLAATAGFVPFMLVLIFIAVAAR